MNLGIVEMLFFFGAALAWGIWEIYATHRDERRARDQEQRR